MGSYLGNGQYVQQSSSPRRHHFAELSSINASIDKTQERSLINDLMNLKGNASPFEQSVSPLVLDTQTSADRKYINSNTGVASAIYYE